MRIIQGNLLEASLLGTLLGIGEGQDLVSVAVVNTAEFLTGTNWPVNRTGCDSKLLLDLIQKIEGVVGITIHFVNKGKNRNMSHYTDLEQLSGLGLNTFGTVNYHNCGVRSHQGTVGIL